MNNVLRRIAMDWNGLFFHQPVTAWLMARIFSGLHGYGAFRLR